TWEERTNLGSPQRPAGVRPAGEPPAPGGLDPIFRRRRALAILALVVAVVVVAALAASGGGNTHKPRPQRPQPHTGLSVPQRAAAQASAERNAVDRVLSYTPAITSGGPSGDEVALTFDDGPGPYTQQLVAVLNHYHVHATFFAIGKEERYFSAGTIAEIKSADVVADHTETHPMMAALSRRDQENELTEQIARIELLGGSRPQLFRPPYGSFSATTLKLLHKLRLLMVLWSTDTSDYTLPGTAAIVQSALAGAHPGAIILMHDAGGNRSETIAALPAIIAGLRKRGLHPVTIPRLMLDDPPPRGLPIPHSLAGD
ncbi:MAG: polysaccharide deacetylase family protein, partial [Solirubrobacteraceae bacterium]